MASEIRINEIDTAYPQAGVDNDTRGFRDNFSIIESNFGKARQEITNLQTNTVKLNESNNFAGTALIDANLDSSTQKVLQELTYTDDPDSVPQINFTNGHYQILRFGGSKTVVLSEWPLPSSAGGNNEDRLAKITLEVAKADGNSNPTTITFNVQGGGQLYTDGSFTSGNTLTLSSNIQLLEFWTSNGGATVFGRVVGDFTAA
jgi:hypothetical protein